MDVERSPDNPAEVTVVISYRDMVDEKPLFFCCLRATEIGIIYSTLRVHKDGNKIDGKELHFNGNALPSDSDVTLSSLVGVDELVIDLYIVAKEDVPRVKIEG